MTKRRVFLKFAAIAACAVLAGCNAPGGEKTGDDHSHTAARDFVYQGAGPIKAVATTGMIHDLVVNIGGAHVQSQALMGPGVDPHLYKATPGDIKKLTNADILFFNGLHLEGKMADILEKMGERKPSVPVADGVPKEQLLKADSTTAYPDPHVWFDVKKWMLAAEAVRDALKKFDPPRAADYDKNAAQYLKKLEELDTYAKQQLATIPKARRVMVTAHDAFRYFGKAYEIEVQGLQGISTASDVSVRDVQRIVELISSRKIKAVFVETSVSKRSIDAVVQGCRAKGHDVKIGGSLFSDAMGAAGTAEGTYAGMVRHNVDTIVKALR
jgi:manganese/zinc/iron transport system substrate-binding protein